MTNQEDGRSPASQGRAATPSGPSPSGSGKAGIANAGDLEMPAALLIDFSSGFGLTSSARAQYLFANKAAAAVAFGMLKDATTAYHTRANDRERMVSFAHLAGEAAVDVSQVIAFSYDDPLGGGRAGFEAWETGMAEIRAVGTLAASGIAARSDETPQAAQPEGLEPGGEAETPKASPND